MASSDLSDESVGSVDSQTPFIDSPESKETYESYEEVPLTTPSPKARKNRVALAGWGIATAFACLLLWSYLPRSTFSLSSSSATSTWRPALVNGAKPLYSTEPKNYDNLFVFGDSYSTTAFDPKGVQPTRGNPLGNSNNNKPTWVEYLSLNYSNTLLRTYNFAAGGSTIDYDMVTPQFFGATSLTKQVRETFIPYYVDDQHSTAGPWTPNDSLFAIWFGINDIVISAAAMHSTPMDLIFSSYTTSLEILYNSGARHFILFNVPPIDAVYVDMPDSDTSVMHSDILTFNARLLSLRMHFQRAHPDISVRYFDIHELYTQVIRNPAIYPETATLTETGAPCLGYLMDDSRDIAAVFKEECKVPLSEYFWQNLHPTEVVQRVTARLIKEDCLGEVRPVGYCS